MNLNFLSEKGETLIPIRFIVIFGIQALGFQSISGISKQTDVQYISEGGTNGHPIMLRGPQTSPHQIRFSRGIKLNTVGMSSVLKAATGRSVISFDNYGPLGSKANIGTIIVLGADKSVKALYGFISRGVTEWEVSELNATSNQPLIETLTVVHDGLYNIPIPDFL